MSKLKTSLAATMMLASATATPMRNVDLGRCILATDYDSDLDQYSVRIGNCANQRAVDFSYNGRVIATEDDYCLSNSDGDIILEPCLPSRRQRWQRVAVRQYRNVASGTCLSVDGRDLILDTCTSSPSFDNPQRWSVDRTGSEPQPDPVPTTTTTTPKPTTTLNSCTSVNFVCGNGATLINNFCGNPQHPKCSFERCCKQNPKPLQTCAKSGLVCQKYDARPINRLVYCGNSGHPACTIDRCCIRNPRTCAKAGIRCPSGSAFVNNFCKGPANPQHPKCDQKRCCRQVQPIEVTCALWDNCPNGEDLFSDAAFTPCAIGRPINGVKECTPSLCCAPIPIQNNQPYY